MADHNPEYSINCRQTNGRQGETCRVYILSYHDSKTDTIPEQWHKWSIKAIPSGIKAIPSGSKKMTKVMSAR